jgi:hypothetical protein
MITFVVAALLVGAGVIALFWDKRAGRKRGGFAHWEEAEGRVTAARVVEAGETLGPRGDAAPLWTAEVTFRFVVDGRAYEATQRRFARLDAGDVAHAERVVAGFAPGSTVPVRHDPDDPARAVIAADPPNRATFALGLVLIALGCFAALAL